MKVTTSEAREFVQKFIICLGDNEHKAGFEIDEQDLCAHIIVSDGSHLNSVEINESTQKEILEWAVRNNVVDIKVLDSLAQNTIIQHKRRIVEEDMRFFRRILPEESKFQPQEE